MGPTVEVRFKGTRKAYFVWPGEEPLRVGDSVIVEAERGRDLGHVTAVGELAEKKCGGCSGCATSGVTEEPAPLKKIGNLTMIWRHAVRYPGKIAAALR